MALTSTLFTGLSGLNVNQTRLNVVGNNIANVNTVAFKSSRAIFKPQFYVTDAAGSPPDGSFGGTNPSQRGLGAVVASIEKNWTTGSIEPTGKPTDMAIDGDGFFVVQGKTQMFTRDGTFSLNSSNELVTTGGDFVQGFGTDVDGNIVPGRLQNITVPIGAMTKAKVTENVQMIGNLRADGDVAAGATIVNSQPLYLRTGAGSGTAGDPPTALTPLVDLTTAVTTLPVPTTPAFTAGQTLTLAGKRGGRTVPEATFTVTPTTTIGELQNFLNGHMAIDTTVAPPAGVPAPGAGLLSGTLAGDPAGSLRLAVVGNTGTQNALSLAGTSFYDESGDSPLAFTDTGTDTAGHVSGATGESVNTSMVVYDSLGNPVTVDITAVLEAKNTSGTTWRYFVNSPDDSDAALAGGAGLVLGNGTLTFDNDGKLSDVTGNTITIDRDGTGAGTPISLDMDFGGMTGLANATGKSTMFMSVQDGAPMGTLNAFSVGANGIVTGSFDNGLTQTLGQVAIASFTNPQGLEDKGGNMFTAGANSGVAIITSPLNLGTGGIRSGALELSNVDLSAEFINLIISSTGFSASSRVITTSDQLITELLNASR